MEDDQKEVPEVEIHLNDDSDSEEGPETPFDRKVMFEDFPSPDHVKEPLNVKGPKTMLTTTTIKTIAQSMADDEDEDVIDSDGSFDLD